MTGVVGSCQNIILIRLYIHTVPPSSKPVVVGQQFCSRMYLFQRFTYIPANQIACRSCHNCSAPGINNQKITPAYRRHTGNHSAETLLLCFLNHPPRFHSNLNNTASVSHPHSRILHLLSLCRIRSNILAQRGILKHRQKIRHLFSGIKGKSVIFRMGSSAYLSRFGKIVKLVHIQQFCQLPGLFQTVFYFRRVLDKISRHVSRLNTLLRKVIPGFFHILFIGFNQRTYLAEHFVS